MTKITKDGLIVDIKKLDYNRRQVTVRTEEGLDLFWSEFGGIPKRIKIGQSVKVFYKYSFMANSIISYKFSLQKA